LVTTKPRVPESSARAQTAASAKPAPIAAKVGIRRRMSTIRMPPLHSRAVFRLRFQNAHECYAVRGAAA
jgi:hypothetical protein